MAETDRLERLETILRRAEGGDLEALHELTRGDTDLCQYPVLVHVEVDRIAALVTHNPATLDAGGKLLAYRYHQIDERHPLAQELPWARNVYDAVEGRLEGWRDPHRTLGRNGFLAVLRHYEQNRPVERRILQQGINADGGS